MNERIYLSPPDLGEAEQSFVQDAFDTNWIAPLGPNVDAFEDEFSEVVGAKHALALSSGTAALHLALIEAGVEAGDEVFVSTLTFAASVNPIRYQNATPVFIDSETESWNMSPALLQEELERRARRNRLPKALVLVHLYGQAANITPIAEACRTYDVTLIEDAAEALGASYQGRAPGTFGQSGIFSFNGNKIITTSGGGMLVSDDSTLIEHARKLSTQARDPAPHYQHSEIGYNYRLSNVLAGIGRGQLRVLDDRVRKRRANFDFYRQTLGELPGIEFQPEADWGVHSRWLTVLTVDEQRFKSSTEEIRETLESQNIEARPVWKPMHLQPIFDECEVVGGETSERLFRQGLCLPSGSSLTRTQLELIADTVRSCHAAS